MTDIRERIGQLLLKEDAKAAGIGVPVTTSIHLTDALRGAFDAVLEDAARAGRRAALVLVSGTVDRCGRVQVWAEPVKQKISNRHDYAELGGGPSQSGAKGKTRKRRDPAAAYLQA